MEGISAEVYKKIRGYWRRRGYERINGSLAGGRRMNKVKLGVDSTDKSGSGTHRRSSRFGGWRIKIKPKLRVFKPKLSSPKKFLVWLRDLYVNMMMGFANSRTLYSGYGYGSGGATGVGPGVYPFGKGALKEYDEKKIMEIYKSLVVAQGQLQVPADAARLGSVNVAKLTAIAG